MKKSGRNDLCPCGSEKKYKKCCMEKDRQQKNEWKRKVLEERPKHLLKHPSFLRQPEDGFNSIDDIITAYTSAGYVLDIEERNYDVDGDGEISHYCTINLICPHGCSEVEQTYLLVNGKWDNTESGEGGTYCPVCSFIREHHALPACPSCNTLLPVLPESERLRYYKERIDYVSTALCPKCGASYI